MTASDTLKALQTAINAFRKSDPLVVDGIWGQKSQSALEEVKNQANLERIGVKTPAIRGKASSFADPADIIAYKKAKAQGKTDLEAFRVGDNGIGAWGADTTADKPMCALPREDWAHLSKPNGTPVSVTIKGKTVICALADTLPSKKNIKNGVVIDLNPAAGKAFGLKPPFLVDAEWRWA